ncbi:MAG TPA: hypothetical protein VFD82_10750 [Planctomycetota bacterium]|nr:hypothetical protein [Planctomycetota bacterium]
MQVVAKAYWLPKKGHEEAEYEDAFAPDSVTLETDLFRCAIADGATEASFSKQWARTLVREWENGSLTKEQFVADISRLQENWRRGFTEVRQRGKLAWYAEQKAEFGAFAALVGFVLHHDRHEAGADEPGDSEAGNSAVQDDIAEPADSAAQEAPAEQAKVPAEAPQLEVPWWEAVAVGDCNLFQLRGGKLLTAFPLTTSAQFTGGPFLVSTRGTAGNDLLRHLRVAHGDWQPHDTFYLMTDALAAWFLRCCEAGEQPWDVLEQVLGTADPQEEFSSLVRGLREQKLLHNDDVTLLAIHVDQALVAAAATAPPLIAWEEPAADDTGAAAPADPTDTPQGGEQES